ncbi:MAG: NRDE family protein [Bacteroidota bacterium]
MCTVTFAPKSDGHFILTSNRDEAPLRQTVPPQVYEMEGTRLLFPKDQLAGGTWIGASEKSRLVCLLNGGFEPHERKEAYRMSRGVIVTQLLQAEDAATTAAGYDFTDIEPFTIVMVDWNEALRLYELVWDGSDAHFSEKSLAPHIWSSSLLYDSEVKKKREAWFSDFLMQTIRPTEEELLHFHHTAGEGNPESNLIMDKGFVKTKSISQVSKGDEALTFTYEDLQTQQISTSSL